MSRKAQAVYVAKRKYRISNVTCGLFAIFMWAAGYMTAVFVINGGS